MAYRQVTRKAASSESSGYCLWDTIKDRRYSVVFGDTETAEYFRAQTPQYEIVEIVHGGLYGVYE